MADGEALAGQAGLPWPPGDVAGLRSTGSRLLTAAKDVGDLAAKVGHLKAGDARWRGVAADRFDLSTAAEAATLRQARDGLSDAGHALRTLAEVVAEAQKEVAGLARRVVELQDQLGLAAQAARWSALDSPGSSTAERTLRRADRLAGELADINDRAVARAEEACEEVRRADRRCATTLQHLTDSAPLAGQVAPTLPATPLALAVAVAYAPEYRFDEDEDHFPMDVRRWLDDARRRQGDQGPYFDPAGEDIRHGDLAHATLPFAYHVTPDGDLQLEYGTFYAFNDFPDAPSPRFVRGVTGQDGPDHEGDYEPITVQLGADGRPEAVDYEAHGHTGVVPWATAERDGLHPRVYVTHGGHGNHPHAGRYENDISGMAQDAADATRGIGAYPGRGLHDAASLVDHWEDDADGRGPRWRPGAGQLLDARGLDDLRGDRRFGEDQGGGNPRSFLHPSQGPSGDLDAPDAPAHARPARGTDEIGIVKDAVGAAGDLLDDVPTPPLPPLPRPPSLPFP